ncbi:MAG: sodium:proton antiporter [Planctomycetes bacterium]|nr:sodium:proton antiporter [Planctomycetota bacterium]
MQPLTELAVLLALGAAAQLLAARLRLPAILPLLCVGVLAGPVAGWTDVRSLFGRMLPPFVSLAVALILFEGGLTLRLRELRGSGGVVRNLVTVGALTTWVLIALAAWAIGGMPGDLAALTGAILALTGPTVVIPLVQHIRPVGPAGPILRWEGILIDPIGALLALLVFEAISARHGSDAVGIALAILRTLLLGGGAGVAAGLALAFAMARHLLPERLSVPITLAIVVGTYVGANALQPESGLLAVTLAGMVLGNRKNIDVQRISQFKEDLGTILLTLLFVVLAANLPREQILGFGWRHAAVVAVAIVVVRPIAVLLATMRSRLPWRDRAFLMGLAPRGIVAAAVSSEFALHLERTGRTDGDLVTTQVFATIAGTVLFYGLFAPRLARWLGLADRHRRGVLFVGASPLVRDFAAALQSAGIPSVLVDTNRDNALAARTAGLRAWHGSILAERFRDEVDLGGIGSVVAMTRSDEVNLLALERLHDLFEGDRLYRLVPGQEPQGRFGATARGGRLLFGIGATATDLDQRAAQGARVRTTRLTPQFGWAEYQALYGSDALPLATIDPQGQPHVVCTTSPLAPGQGWLVIALAPTAKPAASAPANGPAIGGETT